MQEEAERERSRHSKRQPKRKIVQEEVPLPIEAPPLSKYDVIYYECFRVKDKEMNPDPVFIIDMLNKQIQLKIQKEKARFAKEEKELKEAKVEVHLPNKEVMEEIEPEPKTVAVADSGVIVARPEYSSSFLNTKPQADFVPVSVLKQKQLDEEDNIEVIEKIILKKSDDLLIVPKPELALLDDDDDSDFMSSVSEEKEKEGGDKVEVEMDPLKELEEFTKTLMN